MMVVVIVMTGALHLIETLRANTVRCQMFLLHRRRSGAENSNVRTNLRGAIWVAAVFCASLCGIAENQHRDSSATPTTSVPSPEQRVDINHAGIEDLLKIPGMTPTWANRIVRYRPYRTKQDLLEKGILSGTVYDRIKDFVIAHHAKR